MIYGEIQMQLAEGTKSHGVRVLFAAMERGIFRFRYIQLFFSFSSYEFF